MYVCIGTADGIIGADNGATRITCQEFRSIGRMMWKYVGKDTARLDMRNKYRNGKNTNIVRQFMIEC